MLRSLAFCLAAALMNTSVAAQEWPKQPVTMIVPHSPGGGVDIGARTWAPFVGKCIGGTVLVVNKPGAGGAIGIAEVASSRPDGHVIGGVTMPNLVTFPIAKGEESSFNVDSFDYLGAFVGTSTTFTVRKDSPYRSLSDVIAAAKGSAPFNVGVGGLGGDDHLAVLQFMALTDTKLVTIPFGDSASARNALMGGHVEMAMLNDVQSATYKEEVTTLAVARDVRSEMLPDVPTVREIGVDLVAGSNHIIGLPKGAPPQVVSKFRDCLQETAANPDFLAQAKVRSLALNVMAGEEAESFVRAQDAALRTLWAISPWGE